MDTKCVALRYTNGFLNYYVDNWNLYKIGNTNVNFSEQQAINIAIARAKNYSPDSSENGTIGGIKFNVTNAMNIETVLAPSVYVDANENRSQDLLELYPMYNVWVSLDKFYPGNVYGFNVYVWADTGQVCYIHQRVTDIDPPPELVASAQDTSKSTDNQTSIASLITSPQVTFSGAWLMLPASAVAVLAMILGYRCNKKKASSFMNLPRTRWLKISGLSLCLLVLSSLFILVLSASLVVADVTVLSSRGASVSNDEVNAQRCVASYIAGLFSSNGYANYLYSINNQGDNNLGSGKDAILSDIETLEMGYVQYAVVDFDHGVGCIWNGEYHYMFEDQRGTFSGPVHHQNPDNPGYALYDYEIYEKTTTNVAFFAFINTCMSANITGYQLYENGNYYTVLAGGGNVSNQPQGMPYAWTHRKIGVEMSSDGYHSDSKDSGPNCYIGFSWGSASLNQTVAGSSRQYWYWVTQFFAYALSADRTIHTALDMASWDTFACDFGESPLFNTEGFTAIWPMFYQDSWHDAYGVHSHMCVYGNAGNKLYQPLISQVCWDSTNNQAISANPMLIDGVSYALDVRLAPIDHTVYTPDLEGYHFTHYVYNGVPYYSRTQSMKLDTDGTLTAYYDWVPYIKMEAAYGGTSDPAQDTMRAQAHTKYTLFHLRDGVWTTGITGVNTTVAMIIQSTLPTTIGTA
jgi:hypothetical protein